MCAADTVTRKPDPCVVAVPVVKRGVRVEDTVELQCCADDHVPLRTRAGVVSMAELVRSTLRLRPDRIVIGEVRGGEALDLLKAWNTGHSGFTHDDSRQQRQSRIAPP